MGTIVKIGQKIINDITKANLSQIQAYRGSNPIKYIVVHYLGVPNADNPYLYGGGYGGHYNIQRDGQIFKAADPKTAVVWHVGGGLQGNGGHTLLGICTNYNSIGIENGVCYTENVKSGDANSDKWYFTEKTQESLVWLVSKLMDEYNIPINNVVRHYDVTGKICPNPYVKNNGLNGNWTWDQFKNNVIQYRKNGTVTIPDGKNEDNNIKIGDQGDKVKTMQTMLIAIGYSCGSAWADGSFGNGTLAALKAFQKDYGLTVDGLYGPKSKAALENAYNKRKKLIYSGIDFSPVYDYSYYKSKYKDLQKAFGTNEDAYFNHFCTYGMKEGRQACSTFNVNTYRKRYADLEKAYGNNLTYYYRHYCVYGKKEGRKAV